MSASPRDLLRESAKRPGCTRFGLLGGVTVLMMNDTHPTVTGAELMRFLVGGNRARWEEAWGLARRGCDGTNNTVTPKAPETRPAGMMEWLPPRRGARVTGESGRRRRGELWAKCNDRPVVLALSLFGEGNVSKVENICMGNPSAMGSNKVYGVAASRAVTVKEGTFTKRYRL